MMIPALKTADPDIYENLKKSFDKHEIRGLETLLIQDWVAVQLVREGMLQLIRKGVVDVVGIRELPDGTIEPMLKNNTTLGLFVLPEDENFLSDDVIDRIGETPKETDE